MSGPAAGHQHDSAKADTASSSNALPFDLRPAPGATVRDIDLGYLVTRYLPCVKPYESLGRSRRSLPERMQLLRLTSADRPTNGALIAFARDPQAWTPGAYVQFLRFDGPSPMDPIRCRRVLTGRLEDVMHRLDELLELSISVRTQVQAASRESRRPDYPLVALQQLVRNALLHRDYETARLPVRVDWYADRIEIHNPGGLYGQMTPENLGAGAIDYRNPLLATIMAHLGFARRLGLGLPLAHQALANNGNPEAEYRFEPTLVAVTVRAAP